MYQEMWIWKYNPLDFCLMDVGHNELFKITCLLSSTKVIKWWKVEREQKFLRVQKWKF